MWVIQVKGRKYRYATHYAAQQAANEIFQKTGIIVGIEFEPAGRNFQ